MQIIFIMILLGFYNPYYDIVSPSQILDNLFGRVFSLLRSYVLRSCTPSRSLDKISILQHWLYIYSDFH